MGILIDMLVYTNLLVLVFLIVLGIIGLSLMTRFVRGPRSVPETRLPEVRPVIKEREVIRQIVKIRCPYCGNLYNETYDNCPHCGGKRKT